MIAYLNMCKRKITTQFLLIVLMVFVLLYTAVDGACAGWGEWLPGSMSRHRDAVAVAITAIGYGKWQGYASYKAVNHSLLEHGLSVQEEDLARVGATHYFDVMTDPKRLNVALKAASMLDAPAAQGMYYSQDEKGMAVFYIVAFAVFGISSSSWYWLYIALYSFSVLTACIAFRKRSDILLFFLAVACVHLLVANLLPTLPRQDINVVNGNRFLGIMGSVAVFHLIFLIRERQGPAMVEIIGVAIQTAIICLIVNARTSAAWLAIAVVLFWASLWFVWVSRHTRLDSYTMRPLSWPIVILALGLGVLLTHQQFGQNPAFRDGRAYGGHVFWHNLVTVLHNNPQRTQRYGIPAEYPVYDDQVSYFVFDREIAQRGEGRSKYLAGDADWVYRTSSPDLDFRWAAYDAVLHDVFWRTVREAPGYAAYSFLVEQPRSVLSMVFGGNFFRSRGLPIRIIALALILGSLLTVMNIPLPWMGYLFPLAAATLGAALPSLFAAAAELRIVEIFYMLLLDIIMGLALLVAFVERFLLQKISIRISSQQT